MPPLPQRPSSPADAEAARLSAAYAGRAAAARDDWFDPAYRCIMQERERRVLALLAREGIHSLNGLRILDVGCGTGTWLRDVVRWGARPDLVIGVELLPDRAEMARLLAPPGTVVQRGDIERLEFYDGSFDLVIQSTVFTSILDPERRKRTAAEMTRVLKPGGLILWYDFHVNNPSNPNVRRVTRRELGELFRGCRIHASSITLAPPLARFLAPVSSHLYDIFATLPFIRSHTLAAIRPP